MLITIELNSLLYTIDLDAPIDISIPLRFDGPQPSAYGVEPATSTACEYGDLVGDTRRGGSCNFERLTVIPHCNGTHTECFGHITNERISVTDCLKDVFIPAVLVSVEPVIDKVGDKVITFKELQGTNIHPYDDSEPSGALIVRTLPNDDSKLTREYNSTNIPPYFTLDAMGFLLDCGFKHLLVDLPSIDRLFDDGKLLNHRAYWQVNHRDFESNERTEMYRTITELIYVPDGVPDGLYLLNLQIPPFFSDAAPSRPVLFRMNLD